MTEYGTFSALVDDVKTVSGRGSSVQTEAVMYARQALRECVTKAYFDKDLVETTITSTGTPHTWTLPSNYRALRAVKYPYDVYPKFIPPGRSQLNQDYYYYKAGSYFAFKGTDAGDSIDIAYYTYGRKFAYYSTTERPAIYDLETETWSYLDGAGAYVSTLGTTELDEAAQALVTNWLITDWYELILEGALAKIFKKYGDERSVSTFALYKSLQGDLLNGEVNVVIGGQ